MTATETNTMMKAAKGQRILYWASTSIVAFALAAIGAGDLVRDPQILDGLMNLGYPAYFATILGTWMLLGSVAIISPGIPRLKEWAYAGLFFTLSGAAISHAVVGDALEHGLIPLALLAFVMISWALLPARVESDRRAAQTQRESA